MAASLHRRKLKTLACGLTARSMLEKFAAVQMVGVRIPTTDGRDVHPASATLL